MGEGGGSTHTHSWQYTRGGGLVAGQDSARVRGILAVPEAGRRGGLRLAGAEIDSALARVGPSGKLGGGLEWQWCPKRLFLNGELRGTLGRDIMRTVA